MLSDDVRFELLAPSTFGKPISLTQVAEIQTETREFELIFRVEIRTNTLTVVGLLPNGTRVFTLIYDGARINADGHSQFIDKLQPEYLLADLQLSLWPINVLRTQWFEKLDCFKQASCNLTESNDQLERRLSSGNDDIVTIVYSKASSAVDKLQYFHHQRRYRIQLETIEH